MDFISIDNIPDDRAQHRAGTNSRSASNWRHVSDVL